MIFDIGHLPDRKILNEQIFYSKGSNGWQQWVKPSGCTMVYMHCIGAGAGGGGGSTNAAGTVRGGGGGGASGGHSQLLVPASVLPERLFVLAGAGGAGGAAGATGGTGTAGGMSFISNVPSASLTADIVLRTVS